MYSNFLFLFVQWLAVQPMRGGGGWPRPDVPLLENYEHKRQVIINFLRSTILPTFSSKNWEYLPYFSSVSTIWTSGGMIMLCPNTLSVTKINICTINIKLWELGVNCSLLFSLPWLLLACICTLLTPPELEVSIWKVSLKLPISVKSIELSSKDLVPRKVSWTLVREYWEYFELKIQIDRTGQDGLLHNAVDTAPSAKALTDDFVKSIRQKKTINLEAKNFVSRIEGEVREKWAHGKPADAAHH